MRFMRGRQLPEKCDAKACANEPKPPREVAPDSEIDVVRESPLELDE
jgi:hypothetical protein